MRVLESKWTTWNVHMEPDTTLIDKVNGQINAIHDDSLEVTEFKGRFSPFDLDNLESKVCRLAVRDKYEEDLLEHQDALSKDVIPTQTSGSQNSEESTGAGFDENNFSPIPPVGKTASQQGATRLTSTPKLMMEANLNISDPTHNRGKVKRINSFTATQEQVETVKRQSKGGPVKSSDARCQTQPSTSTQENTGRPQVHDAPPVEVQITSGRIAMRMFSAKDAEQGLTLQKCAMYPTKQVGATPFAFIVVVSTTFQPGVTTDLMIIERNQGQHLGTSGNVVQVKDTTNLCNNR